MKVKRGDTISPCKKISVALYSYAVCVCIYSHLILVNGSSHCHQGKGTHLLPLIRAELRANEFTCGRSCSACSDLPVYCRSVDQTGRSPQQPPNVSQVRLVVLMLI